MYVERFEQTEGPDDAGNELDIYWLWGVLDDEKRLLETPLRARQGGDWRYDLVPRGTIVAPYWHVRLDVGDGYRALLHWSTTLARLDEGGWRTIQPDTQTPRVLDMPLIHANFSLNLHTGTLRRVQRENTYGAPTAADKARLLAIVKQYMVFRGREARANPSRRVEARLTIGKNQWAETAMLWTPKDDACTTNWALLRDLISNVVTAQSTTSKNHGLVREQTYRARGRLDAAGNTVWGEAPATQRALEAHGAVFDQLLLWLRELPAGEYMVPWELAG